LRFIFIAPIYGKFGKSLWHWRYHNDIFVHFAGQLSDNGWSTRQYEGENPIENGRIFPVQMVFFLSRWKNQPKKIPHAVKYHFLMTLILRLPEVGNTVGYQNLFFSDYLVFL